MNKQIMSNFIEAVTKEVTEANQLNKAAEVVDPKDDKEDETQAGKAEDVMKAEDAKKDDEKKEDKKDEDDDMDDEQMNKACSDYAEQMSKAMPAALQKALEKRGMKMKAMPVMSTESGAGVEEHAMNKAQAVNSITSEQIMEAQTNVLAPLLARVDELFVSITDKVSNQISEIKQSISSFSGDVEVMKSQMTNSNEFQSLSIPILVQLKEAVDATSQEVSAIGNTAQRRLSMAAAPNEVQLNKSATVNQATTVNLKELPQFREWAYKNYDVVERMALNRAIEVGDYSKVPEHIRKLAEIK